MEKLTVYIGYDEREDVAYRVLVNSILRNTETEVDIIKLDHKELRREGWFYRPWYTHIYTGIEYDLVDMKPFSTEFSHTRFLVPLLNNYSGWALFLDCDMIFTGDIAELFTLRDSRHACQVVKHNHSPDETVKMDGQVQERYFRKNWSSFVLWNCAHPLNRRLDLATVNKSTGSWLHGFQWLKDNIQGIDNSDSHIGHLGFEYNWIEGVSPAMGIPKVIHYTTGGPWFDNEKCQSVMYADKWLEEHDKWQRDGDNVTPSPIPRMT